MQASEQILTRVITEIYSPIYQLAAALTAVYFMYGVAKYIYDISISNAPDQTEGRSHLFYGTIGLFIVLSVGGILGVFNDFFGGFFQ